ncbi:MAG: aminodeoxychorismate/anthranilate synthase component II [Alphaproteobacteria bacterium]|nr:aminodeoxychorismate/anthranilate synthase component II [Alphaproteobacteria bacterium]MCY4499532.1 aminodeoxychorismate/anthranilate synthase component II [Rhodospirillaceae bacterium]
MLVIIDNYDSFTYNLVHFLGELGADSRVFRNDAVTPRDVLALRPTGIVLSPGPCDPDRAGICLELVEKAAGSVPVLGVCLGHQSVGQAFGGRIVRASKVMHGKLSVIRNDGTGVFAGLPSEFQATRYHSLAIDRASVPACLRVTAETDNGVVMGVSHKDLPVHGVQFHPESIASEHGHALLANFLRLTGMDEIRPVEPPKRAAPLEMHS